MASFVSVYEESCEALRSSGSLERFSRQFTALPTNLDRVQAVQSADWFPSFMLTAAFRDKNNVKAHSLVMQAQRACKAGNLTGALTLANGAVKLASHPMQEKKEDDEEAGFASPKFDVLCRAYAVRAKIFFNMHSFHCAALDAQRSLSFTVHPYANAQVQTMTVLLKSLRHIGKQRDAEDLLAQYFGAAAATDEGRAMDAISRDELEEAGFGQTLGTYPDAKCFPGTHPRLPKLPAPSHARAEGLSAALELHQGRDDGRGRRILATRDISVGDVVIIDKPFCKSLKPSQFDTHCSNCFLRLEAFVPCFQCSDVLFCNELCRDSCWASTHQFECSHLEALTSDNIGSMALLAYRCVLTAGIQNLIQACDSFSNPSSDFWNPEDPLSCISNLEQHASDRPMGDMLKRTLTAIYLETCLEFSPKFPKLAQEDKDKLCASILGILQSFSCNAYEVVESVVKQSDMRNAECLQLGGAVYPVVSMTNHSCCPNVMRVSYGTHCVVRAFRPIQKGEEILDNYGCFSYSMPKQERQERLSRQYFFTCKCNACTSSWPMMNAVPRADCKYFCPKCKISFPRTFGPQCTNCQTLVDIVKQDQCWEGIKSQLNSIGKAVLAGKFDGAIPKMRVIVGLLDRLTDRPNKEELESSLLLKQCFNLEGNVHWLTS